MTKLMLAYHPGFRPLPQQNGEYLTYQPSAPAITGKAPMDSRDIAGDILRRQAQMEADRANWAPIIKASGAEID